MPPQMGKRVWPEDVYRKLTVHATFAQLCAWGQDGGRNPALFLAYAADYVVKLERSRRKREARCDPSK